MTALVTAWVPVAIGGGLLRLLRGQGVTLQAVAGAAHDLPLNWSRFTSIIGFIAQVTRPRTSPAREQAQKEIGSTQLACLTTTGFGDCSADAVGHALAVIEMLTGQFYLVTVIGLLIGNFAGRLKTT